MRKSEILYVFYSFVVWRFAILLIAIFAVNSIPLFSSNFLGGTYINYIKNPLFWGHMNFDGEHFLSIAQSGYKPLEYFFFPVFPFLVRIFSINSSQITVAITGVVISSVAFFLTLIGLYKLIKIDFTDSIAKLTIALILIFPTSFYFAVFYSESVFLCLVVWSILLARKNKFIFASIVVAFASATRVIGIILMPVILLEYLLQKKRDIRLIEILIISPLGVLIYMYYLIRQTGDAVIFLHQIAIFGEQRSSSLILLPQVLYRYFFKIVPHVSYSFFPNVFTIYMELGFSIVFLTIILFSIKKIRLSYFFYAAMAYVIPTFAGSFSSMPRYLIVVFPVFIYIAIILNKINPIYKYLLFLIMGGMLIVATSLFWMGYWIS